MSYSRRQLYAMGEPLGDGATRHEVGGKIIYGGGGGTPQKQTTVVDVPDYAKPYVKEALGKASALTNTGYQTYGGERVAQFNPMQKQAFGRAQGQKVAGQIGQATGLAGLASQRALGAGDFQTGVFDAERVGTSSFAQPGAASSFMSPYMDAVVQQQMDSAQRQADIAGTQRGAQAVRAGAFGGSRQAIENAEAARALASQKGQIQATGLQSAFQQAQSQFNQEQDARMRASMANQQAGFEAQRAREQSRQFGSNIGLQGAQAALQGAGQLGQLGQQQFGQEMDITGQQSRFGDQQRAATQDILSTQYQDFLNQQRAPYDQLSFMNSILRGTPMGQTTTQYQPPANQTSQLIGLATAGAGAYGAYQGAQNRAAGGEVNSYAVGGIAGLNQPEMAAATQGMSDPQVANTAAMPGLPGLTAGAEQMRRNEMRIASEGQKAPESMNKLTTTLSQMSNSELQQYALINKGDPYTMALVVAEANRRKEGGMPTQEAPTVVDQQIAGMALPEEMGIAQLPVGDMEFAGGGIIAFQNRGAVPAPEEATSPFGDAARGMFGRIRNFSLEGEANRQFANMTPADKITQLQSERARIQQGLFEPLTPTERQARTAEMQAIDQQIAALASAAAQPAAAPVEPVPEAGLGALAGPVAAPAVEQQNMGTGPAPADDQGIMSLLSKLGKTQQEAEDEATQYVREGLAAERAATETDDMEKAKTFGSDREERLKKREEEAKDSAKQNVFMTMIDVGLRVAAGQSPDALSNIAQGAQQGLKGFQERLNTINTNKEKLDEDFARLYEIREEKVDAVGTRLRTLNLQERSFEASAARRSAAIGAAITGKKIEYKIGKEKSADAFRNAQAASQTPERQAFADLLKKNDGNAVAALTEFNEKFGKQPGLPSYILKELETIGQERAKLLAGPLPEDMKASQLAQLDAQQQALLNISSRSGAVGNAFTVTAGGKTYNFPTQEAANKFKAEAGVR